MASERTSRKQTLRIVSLTYLISLLLLLAAWHVTRERHWLLILLLYAPQVLFLIPAFVLLTISILKRRKAESLINFVTVLVVFFLFMQFRVRFRAASQTPTLKVLTYNIHSGTKGAAKLAEFLKASEADVIFLQETHKVQQDNPPDPAPIILAHFPRWHHVRNKNLMILSRYPLVQREERPLGRFRKCLTCRVKVGNRQIRLINVHYRTAEKGQTLAHSRWRFREYLMLTSQVRKEQTHALLRIIRADSSPTIVAGDFNSPPRSYTHRALTRDVRDCFDEAGWGFGYTYAATRQVWRIDYVFVRGDFTVTRCDALDWKASDHLPVMAEVSYPKK